jgi:hypothetical protein
MGLFDVLMGNATEVSIESLSKEFAPILCENEQILEAFEVIRDKWIFTNKRLILLDIQGLTGKKREYLSIPYRSINYFRVETAGTLDDDCEISIWVRGMETPLKKELSRKIDVKRLQRKLAECVLNS